MLHIHHGNRLETLTHALSASYEGDHSAPFTPRCIVTESQSLARWLRYQFCTNDGIACLIDTPLPADWLWNQARQTLGLPKMEDPLSRERMQWLIYTALEKSSPVREGANMAVVAGYLEADEIGLKRWQLAARIADNFDRYQYYRPELIRKWSARVDEQWQASLWREISKETDLHRAALMEQYLATLGSKPNSCALPDRLDLFALHNLPPLILNAYSAVARHIPVHLWLLAPTPEYWADLASPREMARKRLDNPQNVDYWQAGNPLLTQWGRQGQAFQDLLLSSDAPLAEESEHFREPARKSLLGQVQADIHQAIHMPGEPCPIPNEGPLPSLQVHVCHGPMRECQTLHDTLLHCLEADSSLEPEDILVLVPEISRYAPFIEAAFGRHAALGKPHLPFNISDVVLADEHPLIRAFLDLLGLPESRFTRAEVLGLANIPEVRRRFGLAQEESARLAELFDRLRVFWGLGGPEKKRLGLPEIEENTWQQAFRRIMAGFALGSDQLFEDGDGIAPVPGLTAQGAEPAARFFELLQTLRDWSSKLGTPATAQEWAERLARLLDSVFGEGIDEDDRLTRIRETLAKLAELGGNATTKLPPAVIRHWLGSALSVRTSHSRFYSGGITFCGMKPLRGVPFKVICLMGMQDRAFPRRHSATEFDLMAGQWRHGDPNPAQEDRYLFLETLLAARERLIISYTGRHHRTNEPLQPSVLVQELLDYLDERYRIDEHLPSRTLVRVHPLQPFGRSNFSGPQLPGFDPAWLATARAVLGHEPPASTRGWPAINIGLPDDLQRQITPQALGRFFKNPVRHFVQRQLRIFEPRDIELAEDEPFALDYLEQWKARDQLLECWQQGREEDAHRLMKAVGLLPHGSPGNRTMEELKSGVLEMVSSLNLARPLQYRPVDVDIRLTVNGKLWQLGGRLHHVCEKNGLLQLSASKYKLADVLPLWIEHLCLQATEHPQTDTALYACTDKSVKLHAMACDEARGLLTDLLALYEQGLSSPLPFTPKCASVWMESWTNNRDSEVALKAAQGKWNSNYNYAGESEEFHTRLILSGHDWQPDEEFTEYAQRILEPMHNHLEPQA